MHTDVPPSSNRPRSPARRRVVAAALSGAALAGPAVAWAQTGWPTRPVRLVVGFAAGGPTDSFARLLAKGLTEQLGQSFVVENRPGANANIAGEHVARSAPDGYTFLYNSSSIAISATLYRGLKYDVTKDLMPVGLVVSQPTALVVNNAIPANNLQELAAYVKARPGQLVFGSGSVGNGNHLAMEMFLTTFGLQANHVPYKGNSAAYPDLVGGRIQMFVDAVSSLLPYVQDKRVKPIATFAQKRSPALPDLPTATEQGAPGVELEAWNGVMAPAGTPPEIVQRLNAAINKSLDSADMKAAMLTHGATAVPSTTASYDAYMKSEIARYGKVIKALDLKLD